MSKKNKKIIKKIKMQSGDMSIKYAREAAMPSIFEALVEIITNSDDAYEKLNNSLDYCGDLRIEFSRGGKKEPTILRVKDRGVGMSYEDMEKKLFKHTERVSDTSRGFFGRGLKDVTALGDVTVSSIKDEKFSEVILHKDLFISPIEKNIKANSNHKKLIGCKKSGTMIEVEIPPGSKAEYNPYSSTITNYLPNHYALSKILHEKHKTLNVTFVDLNDKGNESKLIFREPVAELVHEEKFNFSKINASAKFRLFKLKEIVEESGQGFRRVTGISVFGKKACFQKSFLDPILENEPLAFRYFGYLECDYIDKLMDEWQTNEINNKPHNPENNIFILDETRLKGLNLKHPFVSKYLFKEPIQILKKFIQDDKKTKNSGEITDLNLKKLVSDMMKDCSELLNDIDREEIGGDDKGDLSETEWRAIPTKINLLPEEEKTISVYTYKSNTNKSDNLEIFINNNDDKKNIEIKDAIVKLVPTSNNPNKLRAQFKLKGISPKEKIKLSFRNSGQIRTQAEAAVYVNKSRDFKNDIEFEYSAYRVALNGERNLKLFAKVPEVINDENIKAKVIVEDNQSILTKNECIFKIIPETNYAVGVIKVKGLKLESQTKLSVISSFAQTSTVIQVVSREEESKNPYDWKIGPFNLGKNRAVWDTTNPNVLLISSKNQTVKKYLGSEMEPFPYSQTPLFKLLLMEILAEKFAEKRVALIADNNPIEYADLTRYKQVNDIMQQSMVYYEKAKSVFIEKLHRKNFSDTEIKTASN